jgi:hypothetical protein
MPARIILWYRRDLALKRIDWFIDILDRRKFIISGPTHSAYPLLSTRDSRFKPTKV